mmetsp:Transcript_27824/g.85367  ORF Transcript_27824/g.85367 Transcript_27824/m.85367 type:complete len:209 (+) Transcript_27824:17-643(+)
MGYDSNVPPFKVTNTWMVTWGRGRVPVARWHRSLPGGEHASESDDEEEEEEEEGKKTYCFKPVAAAAVSWSSRASPRLRCFPLSQAGTGLSWATSALANSLRRRSLNCLLAPPKKWESANCFWRLRSGISPRDQIPRCAPQEVSSWCALSTESRSSMSSTSFEATAMVWASRVFSGSWACSMSSRAWSRQSRSQSTCDFFFSSFSKIG